MPFPRWEQLAQEELERLQQAHLYRQRRIVRPLDATHVEWEGRRLVNFAANNYLGLTHHPRVLQAAARAMAEHGTGSGAAPLISGYGPALASAERVIAEWKATEAAVLLPSGYLANHAAVQTAAILGKLAGGMRFLVDKLSHASLIDAIRSTGQAFRVFPHNHIPKLRRLLEEADAHDLQVVVTESIFSMDGDAADLRAIAELKREHPFLFLLDEAHATGVYGDTGKGLASELGLADSVDASIITLSKALGGIGGAVCGTELFCKLLVNHARAYLFSTAVAPAAAAGAEAAIAVMHDEPHRQARVRELARTVRARLNGSRFSVPPGDSPIVPLIVGQETAALTAAEQLWEQGLFVIAVRPPTVPRASSRLRVTLSSEHSDEEVDRLVSAVLNLPD